MDNKSKEVLQNFSESIQKSNAAIQRLSTAMNRIKNLERIARNKRKAARKIKYIFDTPKRPVNRKKLNKVTKFKGQRYIIVQDSGFWLILDKKPNSQPMKSVREYKTQEAASSFANRANAKFSETFYRYQ